MARHIDISLDGLHQLLYRIERKELTDGDWAIYAALVLQLIAREQGKQDRMAAKLKGASSLASGAVVEGQLAQTEAAPAALPAGQPASGPAADEGGSTKKKMKGHGRNGAQAFVNAKHFAHGLPEEVLGTCCPACELGWLSRYREKVVIRVVGQPLFSPELHHLEQARCRNCGKVVRAEAPAGLLEGVGTDYIVYDWSACAMLAL